MLAHRWHAAQLLDRGIPYAEVARTRARLDGDRHPGRPLAAARRGRLPARARPPRRRGGRDAALPPGAAVEGPAARSGARARTRRRASRSTSTAARSTRTAPSWDIEVLFARADDIPAWTVDGAVDAAVAGRDQIIEAGAELDELVRARLRPLLRCEVAVPAGAARRDGGRARRRPGGDVASRARRPTYFAAAGLRVETVADARVGRAGAAAGRGRGRLRPRPERRDAAPERPAPDRDRARVRGDAGRPPRPRRRPRARRGRARHGGRASSRPAASAT